MQVMKTLLLSLSVCCLVSCGASTGIVSSQEGAPVSSELSATSQELIDCSPSSDTGYESGNPFPITVVKVDGKPSEIATAQAYAVMQEAARRAGVFLSVVSGFRTMADQQRLYACYVNCNCNQCNLAARPGYSNHQSGSALDLNTEAPGVYSWLTNNAANYGFERTVPSEIWHWELVGTPPPGGACTQSATIRFDNLRSGGFYTNGVWMRVVADPAVQIVRYSSSGFALGESEHRSQGFAVRYNFTNLGDRTITAKAYDAQLKLIGQSDVSIKVTPGEVSRGSLTFESPTPDGWFTNGVWFKTRVVGPIARVEYSAAGVPMGSSTDAAGLFAARYTFINLGWHAVTAVGFDSAGVEVARRTILLKVTP
jgi:D-alanyl-D-alanine carboxypeptidase